MGGSRSGSGSSSRDAGASVTPHNPKVPSPAVDPIFIGDKTRNANGDTCGYYKPSDGAVCRQPRSCYDCLNTDLSSVNGGCVLSPGGACQAMGAYVAARDYRANHNATSLSMAYYNYFPSINSTYCEPTDAACERCNNIARVDVTASGASTQITLGQWNGSLEVAQRFCIGEKGCVCLAACAADKWKNNVQEDCSIGYNSTGITQPTPDSYRSMLPIFMALQLVLIIMVIHRQRMYANRLRRARPPMADGPYNNPRAISTPSHRLELTGWRAMQQDMVNREKAQRGLVSLMSPRDNNTIPPQPHLPPPPTPVPSQPPPTPPPPPHNFILYEPDDDDIPELPPGTPITPIATRRRGSTDASLAMLEDGRASDPMIVRRPTVADVDEGQETRTTQ